MNKHNKPATETTTDEAKNETPEAAPVDGVESAEGGDASNVDGSPDEAPESDLRAKAEKWEKRAGEYTARIEELTTEAARVSDLEKELAAGRDSLEEVTRERDVLAAEAARVKAALEYGLTLEDVELIGGGDPDTFKERAKKLAERINPRRRDPNIQSHSGVAGRRDAFIKDALAGRR